MTISILTATYNSDKTLRDTIDSVMRQGYRDFEYIIIDGGSKDRTLDIIKEYVYYSETHGTYEPQDRSPFFLGISNGTAYYFYHSSGTETTLDEQSFSELQEKAETHVIFADSCTLSKEQMEKLHIIFKKIPRDISQL